MEGDDSILGSGIMVHIYLGGKYDLSFDCSPSSFGFVHAGLLMRLEHSETKAKTETRECETEIETETETSQVK